MGRGSEKANFLCVIDRGRMYSPLLAKLSRTCIIASLPTYDLWSRTHRAIWYHRPELGPATPSPPSPLPLPLLALTPLLPLPPPPPPPINGTTSAALGPASPVPAITNPLACISRITLSATSIAFPSVRARRRLCTSTHAHTKSAKCRITFSHCAAQAAAMLRRRACRECQRVLM